MTKSVRQGAGQALEQKPSGPFVPAVLACPGGVSPGGRAITTAPVDDRSFFGHPRGLAYLAFTEAWERFSFYGMRALLVLFMVQELLLPGHVENVAGMAGFRAALEWVFGPLSSQALASQVYGLYSGLVYFTPVLGGLIADRWLGAKKTVLIGVVLMTLGHLAMVLEQSFLLALLLLILGSGCLKGNIAAQVGHLYAPEDESRSTRGYAIFSTGINVGAIVGPLACGALAQIYGWHAGFAAAGIFMLLACAVYLAGAKYLPDERPAGAARTVHPALTPGEWRRVLLVVVIMAVTIFQSASYNQLFGMDMVWVNAHVDLSTALGTVPVAWFNSIDSVASVAIAPVLIGLWAWMARRGREPGDIAKIGIGALFMLASCGLMAISATIAGVGKAGTMLPLLGFAFAGIAFMWQWPTLLALVSRNAPVKINALLMSIAYLTLFLANLASGWVGTFYERMTPVAFWTLNAAISGVGAALALLLAPALTRALRTGDPPSILAN